jgi:hypothetical protein
VVKKGKDRATILQEQKDKKQGDVKVFFFISKIPKAPKAQKVTKVTKVKKNTKVTKVPKVPKAPKELGIRN